MWQCYHLGLQGRRLSDPDRPASEVVLRSIGAQGSGENSGTERWQTPPPVIPFQTTRGGSYPSYHIPTTTGKEELLYQIICFEERTREHTYTRGYPYIPTFNAHAYGYRMMDTYYIPTTYPPATRPPTHLPTHYPPPIGL